MIFDIETRLRTHSDSLMKQDMVKELSKKASIPLMPCLNTVPNKTMIFSIRGPKNDKFPVKILRDLIQEVQVKHPDLPIRLCFEADPTIASGFTSKIDELLSVYQSKHDQLKALKVLGLSEFDSEIYELLTTVKKGNVTFVASDLPGISVFRPEDSSLQALREKRVKMMAENLIKMASLGGLILDFGGIEFITCLQNLLNAKNLKKQALCCQFLCPFSHAGEKSLPLAIQMSHSFGMSKREYPLGLEYLDASGRGQRIKHTPSEDAVIEEAIETDFFSTLKYKIGILAALYCSAPITAIQTQKDTEVKQDAEFKKEAELKEEAEFRDEEYFTRLIAVLDKKLQSSRADVDSSPVMSQASEVVAGAAITPLSDHQKGVKSESEPITSAKEKEEHRDKRSHSDPRSEIRSIAVTFHPRKDRQ